LKALNREVASRDGPTLPVQARTATDLRRGDDYSLNRLLEERAVSTNTAAAGGNASLMSLG
jgi:RHH-type proline utilization regulon transcriptional repressor/proline dehydrogenase/delta 1-pyrroline-5-carboxylate dehydrogenase